MEKVDFVSRNILRRVFNIIVPDGTGTAFCVETVKGKFLVTAKHMFEWSGYSQEVTIQIRCENSTKDVEAKIYYHDNPSVDVAIIQCDFINDLEFDAIKYDSHKVFVSQDVFMLGFPYGIGTDAYGLNDGYPIPLVKKGCLSGWTATQDSMWVDWSTNGGFSGGPVVYRILTRDGYSKEEYIAGVIKGYRTNKIDVHNEDGSQTGLYVKENTGLGVVYRIETAFEIISKI